MLLASVRCAKTIKHKSRSMVSKLIRPNMATAVNVVFEEIMAVTYTSKSAVRPYARTSTSVDTLYIM